MREKPTQDRNYKQKANGNMEDWNPYLSVKWVFHND